MSKVIATIKLSETEIVRSVRKTWGFMPATKVFKSKKAYDRRANKAAAKDWD